MTNWFTDTRANILRDRLNYIVNKEIDNELTTVQFHLKPIKDKDPEYLVENNSNLIKSIEIIGSEYLKKYKRPFIDIPFAKTDNEISDGKLIFNENYNSSKSIMRSKNYCRNQQPNMYLYSYTNPRLIYHGV